ncbi:MAG: hypothetical protein JWM53_2734 [bacterium]|nr:hypothetical protein [bacterium]
MSLMPRIALAAACLPLLAACSAAPRSTVEQVEPLALYPTPRYVAEQGLGARYAHPQLTFDSALPPDLDSAARAAWDAGGVDRFILISRLEAGQAVVRGYAESARAAGYAAAVAKSLVDGAGRVHFGVVVDGAPFTTRGIVEGHYGAPLLTWQRRCLLDKLRTLRGNVYLYGPKDDPFSHRQWAEPYPPAEASAIADAVAAASARDVDFVWAVSPGLQQNFPPPGGSISFASDEDFARLTAKIDAMRALGVARFALFLDDIEKSLVYDADRATFATPAAAHAALANRLDDYVVAAGAPHLLFVGPYYHSTQDGWRDWADEIGARLRPGIDVLWTGPDVYSEKIRVDDLAAPDDAFGRHVVIWDNQPRDPVAPRGRDGALPAAAAGILANTILLQEGYGYTFGDLWQIVGPLADYAWNPAAYNPDYSLGEWATILTTANPCGDTSDTS